METQFVLNGTLPAPTAIADEDLEMVAGGGTPVFVALGAGAVALFAEACEARREIRERARKEAAAKAAAAAAAANP